MLTCVSYISRTLQLFYKKTFQDSSYYTYFPDGTTRAVSLQLNGDGIWILPGLNSNLYFLQNVRLPLGTDFNLFPPELCRRSVILKRWQVSTHWSLLYNWNVCNPRSEQVCWVAVTLWCLCPNWRSLSRQRVKYECEKKQWWPSSSFLNKPEFLHQSECCALCRGPMGVYALDPKTLLLHHVSSSSYGFALNPRHILLSFFNDSKSLSFSGGFDFGRQPLELQPVDKVGDQARLYLELKTRCEQRVVILVFFCSLLNRVRRIL